MKAKRLKAGIKVRVKTKTDVFNYILKHDDITDIKAGDWDEVGFEITHIYAQQRQTIFTRLCNLFKMTF